MFRRVRPTVSGGQMDDHELQNFLRELDQKKKKSNRLFIGFVAALLLYVIIVLFVLPVFAD